MRISTFKYFIKDSFKNLKRNRTLSTASIATVAATLFILGVFLLTLLTVKEGIKEVQSKVEVTVVLQDKIKTSDQKNIEKKIKSIDGVVNVDFETKKEALSKFKERLGEENKDLVAGYEQKNPLPNSYIVKVSTPEIVSKVVKNVQGMKGIEKVKDGREIVDKIIVFSKTIRWIGVVIFLILAGVSLFLIGNTIKLTVYSRKREIRIMKYIGATDWFIRWPFIMEGIIIGFLGAFIATILLYYGYKFAYGKISVGILIVKLISPMYIFSNVLWIFLFMGMLIGCIGSILSIRKFLVV